MKKYQFILAVLPSLALLNTGCMVKSIYYDVNPSYETFTFGKEKIAVAPFSGIWKVEGPDTVLKRDPECGRYSEAVAKELPKRRKCLVVIPPLEVVQKVPDIEFLVFRHKQVSRKIDSSDLSAFRSLYRVLGAEYLLFFESIFFNDAVSVSGTTSSGTNTSVTRNTILVFQMWDLKNGKFMYRGETKGSGVENRANKAGSASSSQGDIKNTARELVKALPECGK